MDFQFIIPRNNDELLDSHGNNYFVKQVYNANEINYHLKGKCAYFNSIQQFLALFTRCQVN